ncbi:MAG: YqzL family protein [Limnochordia bacterium]
MLWERAGILFMSPVDFFWELFEATGSITAYLLYRQYISVHNHGAGRGN